MRDQLITGQHGPGGAERALTLARPRDYALWGAARGVLVAKRLLTMRRQERRMAVKTERQKVRKTAQEFRGLGASKDEADLYVSAHNRAFYAQMADPLAEIDIEVIG